MPFIIVRVPVEGRAPWHSILKALTPVMRSHGLRQKDMSAIEPLVYFHEIPLGCTGDEIRKGAYTSLNKLNEEMAEFERRVKKAYEGDETCVPNFHLYDWQDGGFKLVRKATKQ